MRYQFIFITATCRQVLLPLMCCKKENWTIDYTFVVCYFQHKLRLLMKCFIPSPVIAYMTLELSPKLTNEIAILCLIILVNIVFFLH